MNKQKIKRMRMGGISGISLGTYLLIKGNVWGLLPMAIGSLMLLWLYKR